MATKAKAIAAMVSLIVATLLTSDIIPLTGWVHIVLGVLSIVAGTIATYRIPNAPATPVITSVTK